MMKLKDKVALVTGGGNGIGRATALRLAHEGARVVVADIVAEAAQSVADEIKAADGEASIAVLNVADWSAADTSVKTIVERYGRLDILINNAGIFRDAFAHKLTEEMWDQVVDINLKGTFNMARAVHAPMSAQKSGRIVNTASLAIRGNPGQANYTASKAGIVGLTRTLALEYARYNITVNCVSPGVTETRMYHALPDKVRDGLVNRIPLKRVASPDDLAALHAFLCSDDAAYITGQTIACDGGITIGLM
jgi:3-oxoacyl-[acyl-carrier protein] reductase